MGGGSSSSSGNPEYFGTIGITLAIIGAVFVGMSLILQKKGILDTRSIALETGNEHAYLKSPLWWIGMICMGLGEVLNSVAYSFAPAIIVTPMTAVSVVVSSIMSVLFLKETLNFTATSGAIIVVLNGPHSTATNTIPEFIAYAFSPGFVVYSVFVFMALIYLVFRVGPRYGHVHPAVFLCTTALGGAYLVCSAQGLGAAVVWSISHWESDNQFLKWEFYPLLAFVIYTATFQVNYLNKALAHFSASIVTPLNFVFFSSATIITTAVLFQGFNVATAAAGLTLVLGFFVIIIGVTLLFQYNLKMNKMTISMRHAVDDINDEEMESEEYDVNPLLLMQQTFPLGKEAVVKPKKNQVANAVVLLDSNPMSDEEYVRKDEGKIQKTDIPTTVVMNPPNMSLSQQINSRGDTNYITDGLALKGDPGLDLLRPNQ
ncbi:hypothetical protein HDV02_004492 [Globomyces sp. JEL0801]|nr:hypothetical protein HDV02_004492 [Globomyces sp. JEL0801]